jgi:hypothetical protein
VNDITCEGHGEALSKRPAEGIIVQSLVVVKEGISGKEQSNAHFDYIARSMSQCAKRELNEQLRLK